MYRLIMQEKTHFGPKRVGVDSGEGMFHFFPLFFANAPLGVDSKILKSLLHVGILGQCSARLLSGL